MPPGRHTIHATREGESVIVEVHVDLRTAQTLDNYLRKRLALAAGSARVPRHAPTSSMPISLTRSATSSTACRTSSPPQSPHPHRTRCWIQPLSVSLSLSPFVRQPSASSITRPSRRETASNSVCLGQPTEALLD